MMRKNKVNPPRLGQWILKKILPSEERRYFIEGIEETVLKGGGYFLWTGCAAGDTGGALILKVG